MRTTLILNDVLVKEAKKRAAEQNATLSAIVEAALRQSLAPSRETRVEFSIPTFSPAASSPVHLTPAEIYQLQTEAEDSVYRS